MKEHYERVGGVELIAYEKLTDHGLALPIFGRSRGANVYYTARSSAPGEAGGRITGFDHYDPDRLIPLPFEQVRETGVGEPWLDIFLWEGVPHVGTASEIWNRLADVRATIAEHAPLSLLALAEGVESAPDLQLIHKAFSWLMTRYGRQKALAWRRDTCLRGIVFKILRREVGASAYKPEMRRALQEQFEIRESGNKVNVSLGTPFSFVHPEDFATFTDIAASFDLTVEFSIATAEIAMGKTTQSSSRPVMRNRTSEDAMRIAALRVAASKPDGRATTTELKNEVGQYLTLTSEDTLPSKTRPNEAMYQQIAGNIVSHRGSKTNIFAKGWATYTGDGIQITEAGRQYLETLGA
jgi:hypothetical protein